MWELFMNRGGLARTNRNQKLVPEYEKWTSTLGLVTGDYYFIRIRQERSQEDVHVPLLRQDCCSDWNFPLMRVVFRTPSFVNDD